MGIGAQWEEMEDRCGKLEVAARWMTSAVETSMYEASRSIHKLSISDVNFSAVLHFWLVFAIFDLTASDVSPTIVSCNFFIIEFIVVSFCTLYSVDPIILDLMTSTA